MGLRNNTEWSTPDVTNETEVSTSLTISKPTVSSQIPRIPYVMEIVAQYRNFHRVLQQISYKMVVNHPLPHFLTPLLRHPPSLIHYSLGGESGTSLTYVHMWRCWNALGVPEHTLRNGVKLIVYLTWLEPRSLKNGLIFVPFNFTPVEENANR